VEPQLRRAGVSARRRGAYRGPPVELREATMDPRELEQRIEDAWNAKDQEAFLSFHDPEHEVVAPGFTGKGMQGMREFWALWNGAFPDNRISTQMSVVEGETIAQASTFQGTHTGPLPGAAGTELPPTGRQVSAPYATFATVRGDRVVRTLFYFDQVDLLEQLGVGPGTGAQQTP
jgi:predicted ester cyclase